MTTNLTGILFIVSAVFCDLSANILLKKSKGFSHKKYGCGALLLVAVSFLLLANAIRIMDLSVAYALFGALGIVLTTVVDTCFFGLRISLLGIGGVIMMLAGVVLIKIV